MEKMTGTQKNAIVLKLLQVLAEEKISNREAVEIIGLAYQAVDLAQGMTEFNVSPGFEELLPR